MPPCSMKTSSRTVGPSLPDAGSIDPGNLYDESILPTGLSAGQVGRVSRRQLGEPGETGAGDYGNAW